MAASNSKIKTIIKHEYITRVKSKGFIISTILGPLGILLFIGIIIFVTYISISETPDKKIAVIDRTALYGYEIVRQDTSTLFLTDKSEDILRDMLLNGEIDGFVIIPTEILDSGKAMLFTGGGGGIAMQSSISSAIAYVIRQHRLKNAGVDEQIINKVDAGIEVESKKVTTTGDRKDYVEIYAGIGYILGLAIYIMMFSYGGIVQRSVIEEKANRIIEVIASSVKPFDIMIGKVVGVGAVGLTQVLIWLVFAALALFLAGPLVNTFMKPEILNTAMMDNPQMANIPAGFEIPYISPWLFIGFIFYFLSGYFLYATLFAAIGSAVDQESDAAQIQTPVMIFLVIPMLFISVVITNPDGVLATVLSLIPFFTPTLMIIRAAASEVPIWQIILSAVLMIVSFFACIWLASKIYRVGILMYGKKISFKELYKWLKMS